MNKARKNTAPRASISFHPRNYKAGESQLKARQAYNNELYSKPVNNRPYGGGRYYNSRRDPELQKRFDYADLKYQRRLEKFRIYARAEAARTQAELDALPKTPAFIGPHNRTFKYVDSDGYTVYTDNPPWKKNISEAIKRKRIYENKMLAIQRLKQRGYEPGYMRKQIAIHKLKSKAVPAGSHC